MFMPSVIGGAMYHAFTSSIEQNRLFRTLQRQYLTDRYDSAPCVLSGFSGGEQPLWIVGTFEHSIELEQALSNLEPNGIDKSRIIPVLMDTDSSPAIRFTDQRYDQMSKSIEIGIAAATASSVIGISVGFILEWGPIIWGILYAICGFAAAFGVSFWLKPKQMRTRKSDKLPEVTVLVQYDKEEEASSIKTILWQYNALTVGKLNNNLQALNSPAR